MMMGMGESVEKRGDGERNPLAGKPVSEARLEAFLRVSAQALGVSYDGSWRVSASTKGRRAARVGESVESG